MIDTLRLLLVYGAACAVLLFLAHRYVRPLRWWVAGVLVLLPMVPTGSAVAIGGFYGGLNLPYQSAPLLADVDKLETPPEGYHNGALMDQISQVVPWRKAIRELVKEGHLPLMNRFLRGGDPLLAASQPAPFDPKVWIGFLLPLATAITFACAFVFFQAALFTFLYLRELEVSELGAVFGAAIWMSCGFLDFFITWSLSSVVVTLPLLVLGLRRIALGHPWGVALALIAWMLALVGGHPESVLHVTTIGGFFFLVNLWHSPNRPRAIAKAVATGLLALGLAAPVLLPFLEMLPQTRDYWVRKVAHPEQSFPFVEAAESSVAALYPHGWGEPWDNRRPGLPPRFDAGSGAFVGAVALAFAGIGLIAGPRQRWGFGLLALLTFWVALGFRPLAEWVATLPLFDIALNGRLVFVTAFALAVLAAFGFDATRRNPSRGRMAWLVAVGLLATVGGLWRLEAMTGVEGFWIDGHQRALIWLLVGPLAAAIGGLLWRSPRGLGVLWLGIFLISHRAELPRFYHAFEHALFYPPIAEITDLPKDGEPYRIVGLHYEMAPGQASLWELEDIRGPMVMRNLRQANLSEAWCQPMHAWYCRADSLEPAILDLFNVRYALANPTTSPPEREWPKVSEGENVVIYENPDYLPRAFVPERVSIGPQESMSLEAIRTATDFRRLAWVEDDTKPFATQPNGKAEVSTRRDGPDLHLDLKVESDAWIALSQTYWEGWHAVDQNGQELELRPAYHALMAVHVPVGTEEVRLFYLPSGWVWGWWVFLASAVVGLGWFGLARRRGVGKAEI